VVPEIVDAFTDKWKPDVDEVPSAPLYLNKSLSYLEPV